MDRFKLIVPDPDSQFRLRLCRWAAIVWDICRFIRNCGLYNALYAEERQKNIVADTMHR